MTGPEAESWIGISLKILEFVGCLIGAAGGVIMLLARKTFASIEDVESRFEKHQEEHEELDGRLAAGDNRFTALTAAIEAVKLAAEQARHAAEQASQAAGKVNSVEVSIARLSGDIKALDAALKPVERFTMTMVEGHMHIGEKTP